MAAGGIRHDLETIVDVASDDGQPVFATPRPRGIDTSRNHRASTVVRRLQSADRLDPRRHAPEGPRTEADDVAADLAVVDPHLAYIGVGRIVGHALGLARLALVATFAFALAAAVAPLALAFATVHHATVRLTLALVALTFSFSLTFTLALDALTLALVAVVLHVLLAQGAVRVDDRQAEQDPHRRALHHSTSSSLVDSPEPGARLLAKPSARTTLEPHAEVTGAGLDHLPPTPVLHVTLELATHLVDERPALELREFSDESHATTDLTATEVHVGVEVERPADQTEVWLDPLLPVVLGVQLEPGSTDLVGLAVLRAHPDGPALADREVDTEHGSDEVVALGAPEVLSDQVVGDVHLGLAVVTPAIHHVALRVLVHVLITITLVVFIAVPALDRRLGQAVFHEPDDSTALPFLGSREHRPLADSVAVDTDLHQLVHHVARPRPRPNSPERILTPSSAHLCGAAERGHVLHPADFQASELSGIQSSLGAVEGVGPLRLPAHVLPGQVGVEERPDLLLRGCPVFLGHGGLGSRLRVGDLSLLVVHPEVVVGVDVEETADENHHHQPVDLALHRLALLILVLSCCRVLTLLSESVESNIEY